MLWVPLLCGFFVSHLNGAQLNFHEMPANIALGFQLSNRFVAIDGALGSVNDVAPFPRKPTGFYEGNLLGD
ncbi:hypothetical protein [Burkholderia paludis]|uniref:hypothetical protein n=1 Tax=Burkholderia paludis TaxID=1506587 RepID=UPI00126A180A|nr:hypothetical protein [Burkholderia paludis]